MNVMKKILSIILLFLFAATEHLSAQNIPDNDTTKSEKLVINETKPLFWKKDAELFREWVLERFVLPESVRGMRLNGLNSISFVVDSLGHVTNVSVLKCIHPDVGAALVKIIKNSPKWTPGTQNGNPVNVRMVARFVFGR